MRQARCMSCSRRLHKITSIVFGRGGACLERFVAKEWSRKWDPAVVRRIASEVLS